MYQASSEQHRKIVSAVARSSVKPPKSMRNLDWPRFLQAYFRECRCRPTWRRR